MTRDELYIERKGIGVAQRILSMDARQTRNVIMKAETQFTAIVLLCGNPPDKRPTSDYTATGRSTWVHQPWSVTQTWYRWSQRAHAAALDQHIIHASEEFGEFLNIFLLWFNDQLTQCVTKESSEWLPKNMGETISLPASRLQVRHHGGITVGEV